MEKEIPIIELNDDDSGGESNIIDLDDETISYDIPVVTLDDDNAIEPPVITLDEDDRYESDTRKNTGIQFDNESVQDIMDLDDFCILMSNEDSVCSLSDDVSCSSSYSQFPKVTKGIDDEICELDDETSLPSSSLSKHQSDKNKTTNENKSCPKKIIHKKSNVPTGKLYYCDECIEKFIDKNNFIKHCKIHSKEKPYICDICFKAFSDKNIMRMHYNNHTGEKPFACTICDKVFANTLALKHHYQMHTGEKPYVCDVCLTSFDHKSSLCGHKLDVHKFLTVV